MSDREVISIKLYDLLSSLSEDAQEEEIEKVVNELLE